MVVLRHKTAKNSHEIPLFFTAWNHQRPRVSAEGEISVADESREKTGRPAARPSILRGRCEFDRRLHEYCAARTAIRAGNRVECGEDRLRAGVQHPECQISAVFLRIEAAIQVQ
jgi:hypothetical protein